jgi:hypothetical protein
MTKEILWNKNQTIGYFPVDKWLEENKKDHPYDQDYFKKYEYYASTPMGVSITQARLDLILKYNPGEILDIGIGSGAFMDLCNSIGVTTYGYDVNPIAVNKLGKMFRDPELGFFDSLSFWDSLEHMKNPRSALFAADRFVFLTIPIFEDPDHARRSKHFRPDEHYWYLTHHGLIDLMFASGFYLVEHNRMEEDLGREDVGSYVFRRGL